MLPPPPPSLHRAPVNLIFVGMLATSFYAVKALNVAMATVRHGACGCVLNCYYCYTLCILAWWAHVRKVYCGGCACACIHVPCPLVHAPCTPVAQPPPPPLTPPQVLKYLTNIFILAGDYYFYNRTYGLAVWGR